MVIENNICINAVSTIHQWVDRLPSNSANLIESELDYEYVLKIEANNKKACNIEARIGKRDKTAIFALGYGIQFDRIEVSDNLILDILESVRKGNVIETIWKYDDKCYRSKGILKLSEKSWYSNRIEFWSYFWYKIFKKLTIRTIEYESW
jgi:hypothetical protein